VNRFAILFGLVVSAFALWFTFTNSNAQTEREMGVTAETGFVLCDATNRQAVGSARGTNLSLTVVNTSATSAFIGIASVTAGAGLVLRQNDAITMDFFKGPIFCIMDSGSAGLRWFQEINVH